MRYRCSFCGVLSRHQVYQDTWDGRPVDVCGLCGDEVLPAPDEPELSFEHLDGEQCCYCRRPVEVCRLAMRAGLKEKAWLLGPVHRSCALDHRAREMSRARLWAHDEWGDLIPLSDMGLGELVVEKLLSLLEWAIDRSAPQVANGLLWLKRHIYRLFGRSSKESRNR